MDNNTQQPVAYADPKSFENFKNLAHLGGLYAHEWMWANPAPGLKPLYASPPAPVAEKHPIAYMRNEGTPNNLVQCSFTCPGAFGVYRGPQSISAMPAPVAVPEGWKLVPIEPTAMMVHRGDLNWGRSVAKIYKAMIDEAPACLDKVKELNQ